MTVKSGKVGLAFTLPALFVLAAILIVPAGFAAYYSFSKFEFLQPIGFGGLRNYTRVLSDPGLIPMLGRSALFATGAVTITVVVALAMAVFLDHLTRGKALALQIVAIVPWVTSTIVGALLFRWLFLEDIGPGLYALRQLGIEANPLSHGGMAMIMLIAVAVWRTLGFAVILLLAGVKGISGEFYEAARVDGANGWQTFRHVTLPLIRTPMIITTVVLTLSHLNNVEAPLVTTGGGPGRATEILPLVIYRRAFSEYDFSGAVALASLALALNIILVIIYLKAVRWRA